jgi:hypothetical protein
MVMGALSPTVRASSTLPLTGGAVPSDPIAARIRPTRR